MPEKAPPRVQLGPSVALVVLSYNYGRFVAQAIESALEQTRPYEQIIVVDDGSTDNSRAVLERYRSRVELIFKNNGGQLSAALHALDAIRCEYVHYLDSDDFLVPNARETIAHELETRPAKLQFRLRCVGANGPLDSIVPAYPPEYDNAAQLRDAHLLGMSICPPTSGNVFRVDDLLALPREALDQRDYIDGTPNMAMLYRGTVRTVSTVIANYRIHGANNGLAHAPTIAVFEQELARLRRRWRELSRIFPAIGIPTSGSTLLELEARNLSAALAGEAHLSLAIAYAKRLAQSGTPIRHKLILAPWMLGLALAPRRLKAPMIRARRSAMHRSKLTRKLVGLWLGHRQLEHAAAAESGPPAAPSRAAAGIKPSKKSA
jgi:glycosyltransferase involved in cell wall biosynthesis